MENIKELFMDIVVFGCAIKKDVLISMLASLYDKVFDDEYDTEVNGNTLFVNKCLPYFDSAEKEFKNGEEILSIDLFIDEFKRLLLKDEQYTLVKYLDL